MNSPRKDIRKLFEEARTSDAKNKAFDRSSSLGKDDFREFFLKSGKWGLKLSMGIPIILGICGFFYFASFGVSESLLWCLAVAVFPLGFFLYAAAFYVLADMRIDKPWLLEIARKLSSKYGDDAELIRDLKCYVNHLEMGRAWLLAAFAATNLVPLMLLDLPDGLVFLSKPSEVQLIFDNKIIISSVWVLLNGLFYGFCYFALYRVNIYHFQEVIINVEYLKASSSD